MAWPHRNRVGVRDSFCISQNRPHLVCDALMHRPRCGHSNKKSEGTFGNGKIWSLHIFVAVTQQQGGDTVLLAHQGRTNLGRKTTWTNQRPAMEATRHSIGQTHFCHWNGSKCSVLCGFCGEIMKTAYKFWKHTHFKGKKRRIKATCEWMCTIWTLWTALTTTEAGFLLVGKSAEVSEKQSHCKKGHNRKWKCKRVKEDTVIYKLISMQCLWWIW